MNVKPGDVAIVIKGRWPNVGRVVQVERAWGDVDYSHVGYGVLPCWLVESLGGDLDTNGGPSQTGYTPDLSLRPLPDITPEQAQAIRKQHAKEQFDKALAELGRVLREMEEQEETLTK